MTGCPNGCARPYTADIAFVGRSLGLYNVYVGGGLGGDRLVDLFRADVPARRAARRRPAAAGALGGGARAGRRAERLLPAARGTYARAGPPSPGASSRALDLVPLAGGPVSGALVLAAHGSRRDPAANALVRRLAAGGARAPPVRRGRRRLPPGRARVRHRARRAGGRGGHGGAGDDQRRALQPTWCCRRRWRGTAAFAEVRLRHHPAGRARIRGSRRWWPGG